MKVVELDTRAVVERVDELLEAKYRSADLGNLDDPLAETIYILLSRQTREAVYRRVFAELRRRYPLWADLLEAPEDDLAEVLRPAGFYRQRAQQLRELLARVAAANKQRGVGPTNDPSSDLTLNFLRSMTDAQAEAFLSSLPGVGPKSARCVLSYSLDRATFAVDTHVHRIFTRLGLVASNGRKKDHGPFQEAVPPLIRKRLHVNLVHHGRAICRTSSTKCEDCVLVSFCEVGRAAAARDSRPTAVDLFAGAGGLGHGFRRAGFRVALAVEPDRNAAQTYRLNNPGTPVVEAEIDGATTARSLQRYMPGGKAIGVLLAGPPCQGYSAAGARDPHSPINRLYLHVARLAKDLNAQAVCLENVPGVRQVNGHGFLNSIRQALQDAGFVTDAHLIHACAFGVPQHRARYFFLGRRGDRVAAPAPPRPTHTPHHAIDNNGCPPTPRLADLLGSLPAVPTGTAAELFEDEDGVQHWNLSTMRHSPAVVEKISKIAPGRGPISYRRLEHDEARTLIAGHRALPVHPTLDRTISVREAAVIQGFPRDYIFCGPRAWQPLQVANAVPPPLAEAVAREVLRVLPAASTRRTSRRVPKPLDRTS
jgi:DNA (cytosine-5)-methyltransferase 1